MVMDYISECYKSNMRLYRDRPDILTPGEWHWCNEGALPIPFFHRFASFTEDFDGYGDDPDVGEVRGKLGDADGYSDPRYLGQNFCGAQDLWENGSFYAQRGTPAVDDQGVPVCCISGPLETGGVDLDGGDALPFIPFVLFPRMDLTPPQAIVPGVIIGLEWTNRGSPTSAALLSVVPGTATNTLPYMHAGTDPDAFIFATKQYLSAPLAAQQLDVSDWAFAMGLEYTYTGLVTVRGVGTLHLIDGSTGLSKGELFFMGWTFAGTPYPVATGSRVIGTVNPVPCADGDYLCLEVGWQIQTFFPGGPYTVSGNYYDSGTQPILDGLHPNAAPMSLISTPPSGEDLDVPITGSIIPFAGAGVPGGYLLCDGSAYNVVDYPALFGLLGTSWGSAGAGTFRVPDLRDRTLIGASPGGLGVDRPSAQVLTTAGGEETHQLVTAELAAHSHPVLDVGHHHTPANVSNFMENVAGTFSGANGADFPVNTEAQTADATTGITIQNAGEDAPHNTMQPFAVVLWLIKT